LLLVVAIVQYSSNPTGLHSTTISLEGSLLVQAPSSRFDEECKLVSKCWANIVKHGSPSDLDDCMQTSREPGRLKKCVSRAAKKPVKVGTSKNR